MKSLSNPAKSEICAQWNRKGTVKGCTQVTHLGASVAMVVAAVKAQVAARTMREKEEHLRRVILLSSDLNRWRRGAGSDGGG